MHINLQKNTQRTSVVVIPKKYVVLGTSSLGREMRIVAVSTISLGGGSVASFLSYLKKMADFTCQGVLDTGMCFLDLFKRNT